jgi:hypothetical protein
VLEFFWIVALEGLWFSDFCHFSGFLSEGPCELGECHSDGELLSTTSIMKVSLVVTVVRTIRRVRVGIIVQRSVIIAFRDRQQQNIVGRSPMVTDALCDWCRSRGYSSTAGLPGHMAVSLSYGLFSKSRHR